MNTKVKYPEARQRILDAIQDFADYEHQLKAWPDPNYPCAFWDNILFSEDTILEEFDLDEREFDKFMQDIFLHKQEFLVCQKVGQLLYRVIKEIGTEQPDSAYIDAPLWMELVKAAQEAWEFFKQQGYDNEYIADLEYGRKVRMDKLNLKPNISTTSEIEYNKTTSKDIKDLKLPSFRIDSDK